MQQHIEGVQGTTVHEPKLVARIVTAGVQNTHQCFRDVQACAALLHHKIQMISSCFSAKTKIQGKTGMLLSTAAE